MNAVRDIRVLTALVVVGACLPVIVQGWELARFSLVAQALRPEDQALRPFFSTPGIAFSARQAAYSGDLSGDDVDGAVKRADELTELLSLSPLSSPYWLLLAGMHEVARQPIDTIV